jgi:hypothetical protein
MKKNLAALLIAPALTCLTLILNADLVCASISGKNQEILLSLHADYSVLEAFLSSGRWKEADMETRRLLVEVMGREEENSLMPEEINNFPCQDLQHINELWGQYSNGRFSFSVQKEIYQSFGGTRD